MSKSSGWFFDDCAICQAQKRADEGDRNLSESELRAAFAEQDKKSNSIGLTENE
jgi:hypothetical protein